MKPSVHDCKILFNYSKLCVISFFSKRLHFLPPKTHFSNELSAYLWFTTTENTGTELTKKNILFVGDSQIRHIDGTKLSNDHFNATVQPLPGARIARMKNVNYTNADVVIIHAGTCYLKKQSDPEELASEIVSHSIQLQESPGCILRNNQAKKMI